jgi:hypothetical protein
VRARAVPVGVGLAVAGALLPVADAFGGWRGALRDATGSFSPVMGTLFGAAVVLLASCLPLTPERLRPA